MKKDRAKKVQPIVRDLSPKEIEELRKDQKEAHQKAREILAAQRESSSDPLAHVPMYDRTQEPTDDELHEKGLVETFRRVNETLEKNRTGH